MSNINMYTSAFRVRGPSGSLPSYLFVDSNSFNVDIGAAGSNFTANNLEITSTTSKSI